MALFNVLVKYHSESRPTFVLITELLAFVASMTAAVGMAVLFSFFQ